MITVDSPPAVTDAHRLSVKREIALIAIVYSGYSLVRNQFGSARLTNGSRLAAFDNAMRVIDVERSLRIFRESSVQQWFLDTSTMAFWNLYYGLAHSLVTVAVLAWLLIKRPHAFRRWRSVLLFTTALALVGYAAFPLMPPRLIDAGGKYGGADVAPTQVVDAAFSDTLRSGEAAWSFESSPIDAVSNQYAAMPSLHVAWAVWCALVLLQYSRRRWIKVLAIAHPLFTVLAVVSTANHYFLDVFGGVVVLALGYGCARGLERVSARRRPFAEAA